MKALEQAKHRANGGRSQAAALYDDKNCSVDRRMFWDEEIYQEELDRIFHRCWLFVAHESQIQEPGQFVSTYMGEDNVLVVRQSDRSIRVLVNSCTHRGNRICHAELGTARNFVCNYHGWSFGLDGRLLGMHESEAFENTPNFEFKDFGLSTAARVSTYKGLVFATFDPSAPSLEEYLGDYTWYLDILLDNDDGGTEFLPGTIKSVFRCNWKLPSENSTGDALHAGWTHDSGVRAMLGTGVAPGFGTDSYQININGHGWQCNFDYPLGNAASFGDKRILSYLKERRDVVRRRLGALRVNMLAAVSSAGIFPNFSFLPGQSTFRVWHPRGVDEVEMHSWVLVNKNAPPEVKDAYRKGVMMTFSPSGVFEMDDGENFEFSTRTVRGAEGRRRPIYYGLSRGSKIKHNELPGNVYRGQINDANQRAYFRRWADFMSAETWSEVPDR